MMDERSSCKEAQAVVVVVMVPFPCHSHLNQLLQLSCLFSSCRNRSSDNGAPATLLQVHYASSATHIRMATLRFSHQSLLQAANIRFHDPPTPAFLSLSPEPNAFGAVPKFPTHLQPSFDSSFSLRQPLASLLQEISSTARRVIVIHDVLMTYAAQDATAIANAECYAFNPTSSFSSIFDGWQLMGKPSQIEEPEGLPSLDGCFTSEILNIMAHQIPFLNFRAGTIYNTCPTIEDTYLNLQRNQQREKKLWAIGPLNLALEVNDYDQSKKLINGRHKCLEWLDKQASKSVLYVSFGTTTSLTKEQIKELAIGLEESKQKFIWVLRDADKGDKLAGDNGGSAQVQLPEGYEERIKEVGMVVRDWAPQLEILGHESTGGFMSHCGWNSCMESMSMGVPIAAWPMHSDQPKNAFLVTDVVKVGVAVRRWPPVQPDKDELVSSSTIAEAVRSLMESKQGAEMRRRAEKLGSAVRQAVREGGVSRLELDSFINHITR